MKQIGIASIFVLVSCDGSSSMLELEQQDSESPGASQVWEMPGSSPRTAGSSCRTLYDAGVTLSGVYWVINPSSADPSKVGVPARVYCDQETNNGGWALVYNSVIGANTLDFWDIPYAQRLGRRGGASLDSNYYDGALYQTTSVTYMDVIEDLQGKSVIALVAAAASINSATMRFNSPVFLSGSTSIFANHFRDGWSARDYDGDPLSSSCATLYNNVTQHYGACWAYNLGSDADLSGGDNSLTDQRLGPHVHTGVLSSLGAVGDGSDYSRVRAIRRYVSW